MGRAKHFDILKSNSSSIKKGVIKNPTPPAHRRGCVG